MNLKESPAFIINLKSNRGIRWCSSQLSSVKVWSKGFAFHGDTLLSGQDLSDTLLQIALTSSDGSIVYEKFLRLLEQLDGNYAFVIRTGKFLYAAVDRIRSIPLFYSLNDDVLYLSDDANCVRDWVKDDSPDPLSVKEFLLTGYVTGRDTLYPRVKQLQAGECLSYLAAEYESNMVLHRYYRWLHGDYFEADENELFAEMDRMHVRAFERLLTSTRGRTIVVPLSGGYDSRLVIAMLKRLGREDVICFSYGKPGNWESSISQNVANKLGYPWFFVPTSRSKWREWFLSEEISSYYQYGCGLCSLAIIQDWPATWELQKASSIPDNAVIVPGHTGDFISGGHIPPSWENSIETGMLTLLKGIWQKHYRHWKVSPQVLEDLFRDKNYAALDSLPCDNLVEMASAFESWEWQERQAKYIVNSVRAYEFWGYDWRIPMWNSDFMDYWARVPLAHRFGKSLYNKFVKKLFRELNIDFSRKEYKHPLLRRIRRFVDRYSDPRLGRFTLSDLWACRNFYYQVFPIRLVDSVLTPAAILPLGICSVLSRMKNWPQEFKYPSSDESLAVEQ